MVKRFLIVCVLAFVAVSGGTAQIACTCENCTTYMTVESGEIVPMKRSTNASPHNVRARRAMPQTLDDKLERLEAQNEQLRVEVELLHNQVADLLIQIKNQNTAMMHRMGLQQG